MFGGKILEYKLEESYVGFLCCLKVVEKEINWFFLDKNS